MYVKEENLNYKQRAFRIKKLYGKLNVAVDFRYSDMRNFYETHLNKHPMIPRSAGRKIFAEFIDKIMDKIILNNFEFYMPMGLGTLSMVKRERPRIYMDNDGFIHNRKYNYSIDYNGTRILWREDDEARKKKTVLFLPMDDDYIYSIRFSKKRNYYSKQYKYEYKLSGKVKRKIFDYVHNGDIDSTKIYNY